MPKQPTIDLEVVGIARRPNKSDLRHRDITGLPDPSPEVEVLRTTLELQQAKLKEKLGCYGYGAPVSFSRMNLGVGEGDEVVEGSEHDKDIRAENRKGMVALSGEDGRSEDVCAGSNVCVEKSSMPPLSVVNGLCETEKARHNLRNRSPIQIHPYVLEREAYRQVVRAGKCQGGRRQMVTDSQ